MRPATRPPGFIRPIIGHDISPLAIALERPLNRIKREYAGALLGISEMFVADVDGLPVACVSVTEEGALSGCVRLFSLDVAPAIRSQGIGTRLIAHVEDEARASGMARVCLDVGIENVRARRLYESLAYEPAGAPFVASWNRYNEDGSFLEEHHETMQRMVKAIAT